MEDLEIKKLIFSRMVTDLIIYDNSFANFVLSSLKKYIKSNWKNEHTKLFILYETNDFKIYIITEPITKVTTILLPEEY